jgi:serine/threonine protein kinase
MDVERQLLFAVLALQLELIDAEQLADVCAGWAARRARGIVLATLLIERGWLSEDDRRDVEHLLERRLRRHGGDARAGLRASVSANPEALAALQRVDDPQVRRSIDQPPAEAPQPPPPDGPALEPDGPAAPDPRLAATAEYLPPTREHVPTRYRLKTVHAVGGLGIIWRARDTALNRDVALKRIKPERLVRPDVRDVRTQFFREAQVTGQLEHPHIVPVYELGRDPGTGEPFYAMKLVRGRTLADAIAEHHQARERVQEARGRPDPRDRRRLLQALVAVGNAVAFAHDRGALHLDLKPENVLLGDYGEVLVLDWGLSRLSGARPDAVDRGPTDDNAPVPDEPDGRVALAGEALGPGTTAGKVQGTPAYMASEQAAGAIERFDGRTDVFGLGAILYEILVGSPPRDVRGLSTAEAVHRALTEPVAAPRAADPEAPPALDALCARALAHEPDARLPDAATFVRELESWLADEPIATYRALIAPFEGLVAAHPNARGYREQLARNRLALGLVLEGMGRIAESEAALRGAILDYEALIASGPTEPGPRADLAATRAHLHRILLALGRTEQAEAVRREALADYDALRAHPGSQELYTGLASVYLTLMPGATGPPPVAVPRAELRDDDQALTAGLPPDIITGAEPRVEEPPPEGPPDTETVELQESTFTHRSGGRLIVGDFLSRGGAASIYAAFDPDLNREVAIKLPVPQSTWGEDYRRFLREAQITAQLEHPNIVPVYGLGYRAEDRTPFLTMRLVRGGTLDAAIRQHHTPGSADRLGLRYLLRCLVQVCHALTFAHSRGVVHQDPKPSNVLIGEFGQVLVVDWGLARIIDPPARVGSGDGVRLSDEARTPTLDDMESGTIVGTPAFMAPEQAKGLVERIDARTDVFVLGSSLFMILTGHPPRPGRGLKEMIQAIQSLRELPRARSAAPRTPPALDAICAKAMAVDPADRYQTARALADDVEHWLAGESVAAYPESVLGRMARRVRQSLGGRR